MSAEVTGLIEENGRIVGVTATTPRGPLEVRADLVIAADGRQSLVREKSGLAVEELGAPMDVLWFGLPRHRHRSRRDDGPFRAGLVSSSPSIGAIIGNAAMSSPKAASMRSARVACRVPARRRRGLSGGDRSRRPARRLEQDQAAHRAGEPVEALVSAGPALHRRCRACDVAGGRRRHQPRGAGRGRRFQYPRDRVGGAPRHRRRSCPGAEAARIPDAHDPGLPGPGAEPRAGADAGRQSRRRRRW